MVDRDGRLVRERLTSAAIGPGPEEQLLRLLLLELRLDELPAVLTVRKGEGVIVAPLQQSAPGPAPARIAAWATFGAALAATATSLGFGLAAAGELGAPLRGDQTRLKEQGEWSATFALGTGFGATALLATSLVLFSVSEPVTFTAGPAGGGGAVSVQGRF